MDSPCYRSTRIRRICDAAQLAVVQKDNKSIFHAGIEARTFAIVQHRYVSGMGQSQPAGSVGCTYDKDDWTVPDP